MENGCPLEWRGVLLLARSTMTQLAVKRFVAIELILDLATMAAGLKFCLEVFHVD